MRILSGLCVLMCFIISTAKAENAPLTPQERATFYHLAEGSELIPLELVRALERPSGRPDSRSPFLGNLERYGLIADPNDPNGLPIGLTANPSVDTRVVGNFKMLGVNCAACHVNEITYQGRTLRIDGCGNRFDIEAFYRDLATTVKETVENKDGKLIRFVRGMMRGPNAHVLSAKTKWLFAAAENDMTTAGKLAKQELNALLNDIVIDSADAMPQEIDAFLNGFDRKADDAPAAPDINESLLNAGKGLNNKFTDRVKTLSSTDEFQNLVKPNLAAHSPESLLTDVVQDWRGAIALFRSRLSFLLTLARSGDVPGTDGLYGRTDAFGRARLFIFGVNNAIPTTAPVKFPHLWSFSNKTWLHWDANTNSVLERNIGQALGLGAVYSPATFKSTILITNVHTLEDIARKFTAPKWPADLFGPLDKDAVDRGAVAFKKYSCNTCHVEQEPDTHEFPLSKLAVIKTDGLRATNFGLKLKDGSIFSDKLSTVLTSLKNAAFKAEKVAPANQAAWQFGRNPVVWRTTLQYPALPLAGIWARAPYLHNGSVPTLFALLSADRPKTFMVGQREYDPKNVGYVETPDPSAHAAGFDTGLPGNSNAGHEWGTEITDPQERMDLIEYLKSL